MTKLLAFSVFLIFVWYLLFFLGRKNKIEMQFLDYMHTDILKGYAILFILFGHVGQYLGINGIEYPASIGVSIFIILSGYGIAVSYQKYGPQGYWYKRLHRVWIPYVISNGTFLVISTLSGKEYTWKDIILNFTMIKPLYAFGWYLRYIFVCYLIFYFVCQFVKIRTLRPIAFFFSFAIWFILRSTIIIDSTPFLQARQMLAFPLGVLLADIAINIEKIKSDLEPGIKVLPKLCIVFGTAIYGFLHMGIITTGSLILYNILSLFTCVVCAVGFLFLVSQWSILQNKGLKYVSVISYELYLIHGYTIRHVVSKTYDGILMFVIETLVLSLVLHFIIISFDKVIERVRKCYG